MNIKGIVFVIELVSNLTFLHLNLLNFFPARLCQLVSTNIVNASKKIYTQKFHASRLKVYDLSALARRGKNHHRDFEFLKEDIRIIVTF